ncbi:MAG: GGDEF domain-containing protein [Hyphomonadaceae bacterium]|nr:GGDEF domain-containing protein [Hyphomonadaceae bacterium]
MTSIDAAMLSDSGLALAHETVDLMGARAVPPTAENYEVWLSYRLSLNKDLKDAIESRISSGADFTREVNAELHERFFANARVSAQVVSASEKIARDLGAVLSVMQGVQEKSDNYGKTLETAAIRLEKGIDSDRLKEVISSLAAATLDMAAHNRGLTDQLQKSTREIEGLRASLASVRAESLTDGLTGLANRRMFDETLRMRFSEARSNRTELCLFLCDIDHFKGFNDTWGHQTGDQILRFIASSLNQHALPDHLVARYGGEEFAVIMPRTGLNAARSIAEALRMGIQSKRLRRRSTNEDLGQLTISIGIARMQPGDRPETLLDRADTCLYASKRNGRNQVTTDAAVAANVA